jgi:hypothetical protein
VEGKVVETTQLLKKSNDQSAGYIKLMSEWRPLDEKNLKIV